MTTAAISSAARVFAPAAATSELADIEPPTGMPWKMPARTLPAPWPTKSWDSSCSDPSSLGNPADTPAPWTSPTKASDRAGMSSEGISPSTGSFGRGSDRGTSAMSRTSSIS